VWLCKLCTPFQVLLLVPGSFEDWSSDLESSTLHVGTRAHDKHRGARSYYLRSAIRHMLIVDERAYRNNSCSTPMLIGTLIKAVGFRHKMVQQSGR
jgi:hypothetical protein